MVRQQDLFELASRQARRQRRPGPADVRSALRHAIKEALRASSLSREEVADRMSESLGACISRAQLDAWTATSKPGHRIPAEYLPAFVEATGDPGPLQAIVEPCGYFVADKKERTLAEIARLEQQEKEARNRKRLLQKVLEHDGATT